MGAPVLVELGGETDPLHIAMKELKQRKVIRLECGSVLACYELAIM